MPNNAGRGQAIRSFRDHQGAPHFLTRISLHYLFAVSVLTLYGGQV